MEEQKQILAIFGVKLLKVKCFGGFASQKRGYLGRKNNSCCAFTLASPRGLYQVPPSPNLYV